MPGKKNTACVSESRKTSGKGTKCVTKERWNISKQDESMKTKERNKGKLKCILTAKSNLRVESVESLESKMRE